MSLHQGQPVLSSGQSLDTAKAVMIMLHGRGASAESILSLVPQINHPEFAYLAPQAAGDMWYPYRFLEPVERNEPYLSAALGIVTELVDHVKASGVASEQIMLLGFSQGACLVVEWAARNPARFGGVMVLSGGLIGDKLTQPPGSLAATPVFFGCSDVDSHIPKGRVDESADMLAKMGADVTKRLYSGMGHTINLEEIAFVHAVMLSVVRSDNK